MKVLILNGPNINFIGIREKNLYGSTSYDELLNDIEKWAKELNLSVEVFQSNHEGALIDKIQESYKKVDYIVINGGGYSHTSIALLDALKAVSIPYIEVHLTKISEREKFRHFSYLSLAAKEVIEGKGIEGYHEALMKIAREKK